MSSLKDIIYEKASINELPRIVQMKIAMFEEGGHAGLLAANAYDIILQDYQSLYDQSLALHFVARSNGSLIASAGAFIKADLPYRYFSPPFYGFIGDVYCQPAYRKLGIATTLTQQAIAWLQKKGVKEVKLIAFRAARPIYERLGFHPTDEMVLELDNLP